MVDYQSPLWLSHSLDFSVRFLAVLLLNRPVSQLEYWPSLNGCGHWDYDCLTVFNKATDHGAFSSFIPNRVSSLKSVSFMEPPSYKIFQKEWIITMLKCYWIIYCYWDSIVFLKKYFTICPKPFANFQMHEMVSFLIIVPSVAISLRERIFWGPHSDIWKFCLPSLSFWSVCFYQQISPKNWKKNHPEYPWGFPAISPYQYKESMFIKHSSVWVCHLVPGGKEYMCYNDCNQISIIYNSH